MAYQNATEENLYDLIKGDSTSSQDGANESNLYDYIQSAPSKSIASPSFKNALKGAEFFARGGQYNAPQVSKDFGKSVAALLDQTIGGVLPTTAGYVTQAFARPFTSAQNAEQIAQKVSGAIDKPFGKAFGITEEPAYKNEGMTKIMNFVGQNMGKGAKWVSEQTGIPEQDVAHMMNSLVIAGGHAANTYVKPTLQAEFAKAQSALNPKVVSKAEYAKPIEPIEVTGVGATEAPKVIPTPESVAEQPNISQPQARNVEVLPENPPMPTEPLPIEALSNREQLLRDVGVENIRKSAVENNPLEASSQYITSKAEKGPYGQGIREQINHEKEALTNHFGGVESELGGTVPRKGSQFEITDEMERGKAIKTALEDAQKAHADETTRLYDKASEEVGNVPVELTGFKQFLDKDSNFVHVPEKALKNGVRDYLKEQGLLAEDGSINSMTVKQSENLRKFINKQYNHETSSKIGDLVNNIDDDVFSNVRGDTYEQARAHFKAGKEIYDNPKAIKNLLGDEGVNQKIADEKVMSKISTLDESQFGHLMNTLRSTGKSDAVREIQTNLVNRIKEAGQSATNEPWNSIAAAKERAKLGNKLQVAFADNPEILDKIDKGIEAGNILHIPNKYPGAAVQSHLLHNKFTEFLINKGAGPAGAYLGGPMGAMAGEWLGQKASNVLDVGKQSKLLKEEIKYNQSGKNKPSDFGLKP